MATDEQEGIWNAERQRIWRKFIDAAEASAAGHHQLAFAYAAECPWVANELRSFVRAIRSGKVTKLGAYKYRPKRG